MAAAEEQATNSAVEKEHEKLLAKSNNGAFTVQRYGEPTPTGSSGQKYGEPGPSGRLLDSSQNISAMERSYSYTSENTCNRSDTVRSPGTDDYLKQAANEEEAPKADCKRKTLKVAVTLMFLFIVIGVVIIWSVHEGRSRKHIGNEFFDFVAKKRVLNVYNSNNDLISTGYLKVSDFNLGKAKLCDDVYLGSYFCYRFEDSSMFKFNIYKIGELNCINIIWDNVVSERHVPTDCYDIEYGLWFGVPNYKSSFWPVDINELSFDFIPYRPGYKDILGNVLENYWLNTDGVAVVAPQEVPLKISVNSGSEKRLCLTLDLDSLSPGQSLPVFNYSVCQGRDIKHTHLATRNSFLPKTAQVAYDKHDFSQIVWSYKNKNPNKDDGFGQFLHKLKTANLPMNMVEYDASWEPELGDLRYEESAYQEINLRLKGKYSDVKLMLPVSLACSYLSENFIPGLKDALFVQDAHTNAAKVIHYDGKNCGLWDATNPNTRKFLTEKLDSLHNGEPAIPNEFPQAFKFQSLLSDAVFPILLYKNSSCPNMMNKAFINLLLKEKPLLVQSAYHFQNRPVFVEIPTTVVTKDNKKCLDYIIAGALTAGIHGYPYVFSEAPEDGKIDLELFMRWLQVAVFFPGLKIPKSVVYFGDKAINLTQNLNLLREKVVLPEISKASAEVGEGSPILRPLWWINPLDYKTLKIADQFLLGSSVMVAPVLCHGDRSRDIYLPEGDWVDRKTGEVLTGRKWLRAYPVPDSEIPVFIAQESEMTPAYVTGTTEKT